MSSILFILVNIVLSVNITDCTSFYHYMRKGVNSVPKNIGKLRKKNLTGKRITKSAKNLPEKKKSKHVSVIFAYFIYIR